MTAELRHRSLSGLHAVYHDFSAVGSLIKLWHQSHNGLAQRTLSSPVFPDNANKLALFHGKVQSVQRQLLCVGITVS